MNGDFGPITDEILTPDVDVSAARAIPALDCLGSTSFDDSNGAYQSSSSGREEIRWGGLLIRPSTNGNLLEQPYCNCAAR